ncbi:MAG: hypothetical protein JF606_30090 [Burkholderiales bacterium]|nr:hypothetical protein [Burkholderiales bacterium]
MFTERGDAGVCFKTNPLVETEVVERADGPTELTGDLITAMSRLRGACRHGAPQSVATTADALGLDARQLAAYVTDDGNLHTNPLLQQWLLTLPRDELDALLRYHDNG